MKLIDDMNELEAKKLLNEICRELEIGEQARKKSVIMRCIGNATRRENCLSKIEHYLVTTETNEDGKEYEEPMLNWGELPEKYIETFKIAIDLF